MAVIGLDLGNYYTFPSFVEGMDPETRKGGTPRDLLRPDRGNQGIPSAYSPRSSDDAPALGYDTEGRPTSETLLLLKSRIGERWSITLRGNQEVGGSCDKALTQVAQYCIRVANTVMQRDFQTTSNEVALAHPVTFDPLRVRRLIEIVEAATLEDGKQVKVVGTIEEPAAAALDYLATEVDWKEREATVLVYDLGAGTFDTTLLVAYPNGRTDDYGHKKYYETLDSDGVADVGGAKFTDRIVDMIGEQIGGLPRRGAARDEIEHVAESTKRRLTDTDDDTPYIENRATGEYYDIRISREDFEHKTKDLLDRTIACMKELLTRHPKARPSRIVLTGGASQMPMVRRAVEAAFGEGTSYDAKVVQYRPSKAISYGASRYYMPPTGVQHRPGDGGIIARVPYDIGVRYYDSDVRDHVRTFVHAGVQLPTLAGQNHTSQYIRGETHEEGQLSTVFRVYVATRADPDPYALDTDWKRIGTLTLEHGRPVPKGTRLFARIIIDHLRTLHVEAYEDGHANEVYGETSVQYNFD